MLDANGHATRIGQGAYITEHVSCEVCGADNVRSTTVVPAHYSNDRFSVAECFSCGLMFVNPRLTSEFRSFCYERETHLLDCFRQSEAGTRRAAPAVMNRLRQLGYEGGHLLEIGCGSGTFLDVATDFGFECTGVEINRIAAEHTSARHRIVCGDFLNVTIPDGPFDVVVLEQTLEHVGTPLKTLQKARELVRPGGCVYIGVPRVDWFRMAKAFLHLDDAANPFWSPEDHIYYYTARSMAMLLHAAGFRSVPFARATWKSVLRRLLRMTNGQYLGIRPI